jgi:hypothetical protein
VDAQLFTYWSFVLHCPQTAEEPYFLALEELILITKSLFMFVNQPLHVFTRNTSTPSKESKSSHLMGEFPDHMAPGSHSLLPSAVSDPLCSQLLPGLPGASVHRKPPGQARSRLQLHLHGLSDGTQVWYSLLQAPLLST